MMATQWWSRCFPGAVDTAELTGRAQALGFGRIVSRYATVHPLETRLIYYAFGLIWFRTTYFDLKSLMIHFFGTR